MFESVLLSLLNQHLGDFIDGGFDANQLKVGVWKGRVKLENLRVKASAFDFLNLPIVVADGYKFINLEFIFSMNIAKFKFQGMWGSCI